ncbi:hypothetical protein HMPREF1548_04673 [Clostridium sp. KLE 1755]|nr:hypothetical protein HMPREF1548_04673 [Clostridium sp. KLE 1755]
MLSGGFSAAPLSGPAPAVAGVFRCMRKNGDVSYCSALPGTGCF